MSCNPMFRALHEIYEDHYGNCSELKTCLVDILGTEEIMRKCKHCGLDVEYPELYNQIENNMKVRGER